MGSGRRYTDENIQFVLNMLVQKKPKNEIIEAFEKRFPDHEYIFGPKQVKYIKQGYGKHPEFG